MNNNTKEVLLHLIWAIAIMMTFIVFLLVMAWIGSPTDFSISFNMDNNTKDFFYGALNYSSNDFNNLAFDTRHGCELCCKGGYLSTLCSVCDCQEKTGEEQWK